MNPGADLIFQSDPRAYPERGACQAESQTYGILRDGNELPYTTSKGGQKQPYTDDPDDVQRFSLESPSAPGVSTEAPMLLGR